MYSTDDISSIAAAAAAAVALPRFRLPDVVTVATGPAGAFWMLTADPPTPPPL